jgi:DNA-binding CsgD family transcriptional regulator
LRTEETEISSRLEVLGQFRCEEDLVGELLARLARRVPAMIVAMLALSLALTGTRSLDSLLLEAQQTEVLLTAREREVLAWVARGKTNAEIARQLWLAPSTVRKHLENVYAKLGVSTRTAAVARFLGLIDAEAS